MKSEQEIREKIDDYVYLYKTYKDEKIAGTAAEKADLLEWVLKD